VTALLKSNSIFLVDVREPNEFGRERIAGAFLFPLSSFNVHAIPDDKVHEVVFCCGSGKRSLDAAQRWLSAGRSAGGNLDGGLAAWKLAELPVTSASVQREHPLARK
jgi:rhodanese-related sulfurtransferase